MKNRICLFVLFFFSLTLNAQHKKKEALSHISADDPKIKYTGRIDFSNPKAPRFAWSGVSIKASFQGSHCEVLLNDYASGEAPTGEANANWFNLIIDNKKIQVVKCQKDGKQIYKVEALSDSVHTIEIFKRTEALIGEADFRGFILGKDKKLLDLPAAAQTRKIEFIGNSITCGYGNEGADKDCKFSASTENNYMAYGAITARNLNAEYVAVPFSGKGLYRNYDESTDETMPMLYDRIFASNPDIKWDFKKYTPDVVVINLGTNDFAHSNPDSAIWVQTYIKFIGTIRSNYPNAHIICLNGSMMNDSWPQGTKSLSTIKKFLKAVITQMNDKGDNKVYMFSLSPQGSLGYGCDWHPNVAQHKKNAAELTAFIKTKTGW
ncbi:MAG: SGNH/GDSL hydrolase family protein [Cytophagaceae bacterium]